VHRVTRVLLLRGLVCHCSKLTIVGITAVVWVHFEQRMYFRSEDVIDDTRCFDDFCHI
jgi:hypothetical protein